MKKLIVAVLVVAFGAFAWWLLPTPPRPQAEQSSGGHASHGGDPAALSDGTVLAVDRAAKNVTIAHGPRAARENQDGRQVVRFHADVVRGTFTVMNIEPVS